VIAPFLAVLAARGAGALWEVLPSRPWRRVWAAAVGIMVPFNVAWMVASAASIRGRGRGEDARRLAAHLAGHPRQCDFLSARVRAALAADGLAPPPNAPPDPGAPVDGAALYPAEARPVHDWPANRPDLTLTWFGPYEVNFNYY